MPDNALSDHQETPDGQSGNGAPVAPTEEERDMLRFHRVNIDDPAAEAAITVLLGKRVASIKAAARAEVEAERDALIERVNFQKSELERMARRLGTARAEKADFGEWQARIALELAAARKDADELRERVERLAELLSDIDELPVDGSWVRAVNAALAGGDSE